MSTYGRGCVKTLQQLKSCFPVGKHDMSGFIQGEDRTQGTLFPERLDDYVAEDNPVRVIDVFIDDLDISGLGFKAEPAATGRPGYRPKVMLKLDISTAYSLRVAWNAKRNATSS